MRMITQRYNGRVITRSFFCKCHIYTKHINNVKLKLEREARCENFIIKLNEERTKDDIA